MSKKKWYPAEYVELLEKKCSDHAAALRQAKIDMADKNTDIITEHLPSGSIMPLWIVRAMNAIRAEAAREKKINRRHVS